jgi:indole-3-glycerol phosphate synthase
LGALRRGRDERGIGFIAEYKRASPSLGDIDLSLGPEEAIEAYSGADCLSVLTERDFFKGDLDYLRSFAPSGKPLLRKDFLFHPLQLRDTALYPASAALLMAGLLPDPKGLSGLLELARSLGLCPVLEVFGPSELDLARAAGASLIQVNARDLSSLSLDLENSLALIRSSPPREGEFWIAASGVRQPGDLRRLAKAGYGAALVGTALMSSGRPRETLQAFLGACL